MASLGKVNLLNVHLVQDVIATAVRALDEIACSQPDTDDIDTRDRSYGQQAEMAQDALDEIRERLGSDT